MIQPSSRIIPITLGRGLGNAESFRRFWNAQSNEIAELDQFRFRLVHGGQLLQRFVHSQQLIIARRYGNGDVRLQSLFI